MLRRAAILVLIASMTSSCAVLRVFGNREVTRALASSGAISSDLAERLDMYQRYAEKFRRFHDSGELASSDVLEVLADTGVIESAPTPAPRGHSRPRTAAPKPKNAVPPPTANYTGQYRWPTDAGIVSSEFGHRWGKNHDGIDIAADKGEPVKASADGVIIYSGNGLRGYGNVLIVRHDDRTTSLYAHNSQLLADKGARVKAGQLIALLGSTGHSTGPHVHFEIRVSEKAVDPRSKLGKASFACELGAPGEALARR